VPAAAQSAVIIYLSNRGEVARSDAECNIAEPQSRDDYGVSRTEPSCEGMPIGIRELALPTGIHQQAVPARS
jgi:hypothetical protein